MPTIREFVITDILDKARKLIKENIEIFKKIAAETKFGDLLGGDASLEAIDRPATDADVTKFIDTLFNQPLAVWPFYRENVRKLIYEKFGFSPELKAEFEKIVHNVQHVLNKLGYKPQA